MNTMEKLGRINYLYKNTTYGIDVANGKIYLVENTVSGICRYDFTKPEDFEKALDQTLANAEDFANRKDALHEWLEKHGFKSRALPNSESESGEIRRAVLVRDGDRLTPICHVHFRILNGGPMSIYGTEKWMDKMENVSLEKGLEELQRRCGIVGALLA